MIKTKLILFFILVAITAIGQELVTVEVSSDAPRVGDVFQIKCTVEDSNGFPEKMEKESFYLLKFSRNLIFLICPVLSKRLKLINLLAYFENTLR